MLKLLSDKNWFRSSFISKEKIWNLACDKNSDCKRKINYRM